MPIDNSTQPREGTGTIRWATNTVDASSASSAISFISPGTWEITDLTFGDSGSSDSDYAKKKKSNTKEEPEVVENRNMELDNFLGNLMIAEMQVARLRDRIAGVVAKELKSVHSYKHKGQWYKITNVIEKVEPPKELSESDKESLK